MSQQHVRKLAVCRERQVCVGEREDSVRVCARVCGTDDSAAASLVLLSVTRVFMLCSCLKSSSERNKSEVE